MENHTYPLFVSVYKGEGRILIIPWIDHIGGYSVPAEWFANIRTVGDGISIGKSILSAIDFIKDSPRSDMMPKELELSSAWKKNSIYKSKLSFWKNNYYARVLYYDDKHYAVHSMKKSEKRSGGYSEYIKDITLSPSATAEEIGQAVIDVFNAAEEYYGNQPAADTFPPKQLELIDGSMLTVKPPKDKHFEDCGDAGSAEIYQCYSYKANDDAESSADFYVGIAPELDCNLNSENIRAAWEEIYGEAEHFAVGECECGIFKLRVEMRNKQTHRISYLLQMEEDLLLECGMAVHQPNRRKKMDEKLGELFEEFVVNCTMK